MTPNSKLSMPPEMQVLLDRFSSHVSRNTLSHALLFHGLPLALSETFLKELSATLLCSAQKKPCHVCQSCLLVLLDGHPDLTLIQPEKTGSPIKIDIIRDLSDSVYLSPQLGCNRVVIIRLAEKMNIAASNAVLKLLEEPPNNVYFILQVTNLSTLLPTVLSRCQLWRVVLEHANYQELQDLLGNAQVLDADLAKVMEDFSSIVADLQRVLVHKQQFCGIAAKWAIYNLSALTTVLYWINTSLIKELVGQDSGVLQLRPLLPHVTVIHLFRQLDKLNQIMKLLNQSIAINVLLTLEDFLLGYVP